ncbi:hypothetical protein KFL_002170010 [Klebsormidium nitens]|uniref:Uncharacterized protein n=1 Tax=Klebsormidium nitens TaxID=105231 RepID=A0A1Y1I8H7_KLENI|nr:hypothetical protein KFL_002170010 [Klebsormidium nitens]|eukprot:GAQ85007.1 hypothetical protein KFL_002170010 [Klebsormidium nitens]
MAFALGSPRGYAPSFSSAYTNTPLRRTASSSAGAGPGPSDLYVSHNCNAATRGGTHAWPGQTFSFDKGVGWVQSTLLALGSSGKGTGDRRGHARGVWLRPCGRATIPVRAAFERENERSGGSYSESVVGKKSSKSQATHAEEFSHTKESRSDSDAEHALSSEVLPPLVPSVALLTTHEAKCGAGPVEADSADEQPSNDEARQRSESQLLGRNDSTEEFLTAGREKPTVKSKAPRSEEGTDASGFRGGPLESWAEPDTGTSAELTTGESSLLERGESFPEAGESQGTAAAEERMGGHPGLHPSVSAASDAEREPESFGKGLRVVAIDEVSSETSEGGGMTVAPGKGRSDSAEGGRDRAGSGMRTNGNEEALEGAESLQNVDSGESSATEPERMRGLVADDGEQTKHGTEEGSEGRIVPEPWSGAETPGMVPGTAGTETAGEQTAPSTESANKSGFDTQAPDQTIPADVQDWIDSDVVFSPYRAAPLPDLSHSYEAFCKERGMVPRGGKRPEKIVSRALLTSSPDVRKSYMGGPRAGYRGVRIRDRPLSAGAKKGGSISDDLDTWARACLEVCPGHVTPVSGAGSLLQSYERFFGGDGAKELFKLNVFGSTLERTLTSLDASVVEKTRIPGHSVLEGVGLKRNGSGGREGPGGTPPPTKDAKEPVSKRARHVETGEGNDETKRGSDSNVRPDPRCSNKLYKFFEKAGQKRSVKDAGHNRDKRGADSGSQLAERRTREADNGELGLERIGELFSSARRYVDTIGEAIDEARDARTGRRAEVPSAGARGVSGAVSFEELVGKLTSVGDRATSRAVEAYNDAVLQADAGAAALRAATSAFAAAASAVHADVQDLEDKKRDLNADREAYAGSVRALMNTRKMLGDLVLQDAAGNAGKGAGASDRGTRGRRSGETEAVERGRENHAGSESDGMGAEAERKAEGSKEASAAEGEGDTWHKQSDTDVEVPAAESEAVAEALRVAAEAPFVVRAAEIAVAAANVEGLGGLDAKQSGRESKKRVATNREAQSQKVDGSVQEMQTEGTARNSGNASGGSESDTNSRRSRKRNPSFEFSEKRDLASASGFHRPGGVGRDAQGSTERLKKEGRGAELEPEPEAERDTGKGERNLLWAAVEMAREDSEEGLEDFGAAVRQGLRAALSADTILRVMEKIQRVLEVKPGEGESGRGEKGLQETGGETHKRQFRLEDDRTMLTRANASAEFKGPDLKQKTEESDEWKEGPDSESGLVAVDKQDVHEVRPAPLVQKLEGRKTWIKQGI